MSDAKVKYDPQVDILRIKLASAPIEESEQIGSGLIVDYDAAGNIVGIELLDASLVIAAREQMAEMSK